MARAARPTSTFDYWELHAAVFELARARGLNLFEVYYADTGDEIEIGLAIPPANDTRPTSEPSPPPSDNLC